MHSVWSRAMNHHSPYGRALHLQCWQFLSLHTGTALPTICIRNHPVCKEIKGDSWVSCSLSTHLLGVQRRLVGKIRCLEIKVDVGQAVLCSPSGAELLAQRMDHSFWSLAQVMMSGDSSKALKASRDGNQNQVPWSYLSGVTSQTRDILGCEYTNVTALWHLLWCM